MAKELIIVADLQRFKLYSVEIEPLGRESVALLESVDSLEIHNRVSQKVSDQYGRFQGSSPEGVLGSGAGEDHNLVLEEVRRREKEIAGQIAESLKKHACELWYFAAPKAINNQIIALLDAGMVKNMKVNLNADLTKIPDNQLLKHFKK